MKYLKLFNVFIKESVTAFKRGVYDTETDTYEDPHVWDYDKRRKEVFCKDCGTMRNKIFNKVSGLNFYSYTDPLTNKTSPDMPYCGKNKGEFDQIRGKLSSKPFFIKEEIPEDVKSLMLLRKMLDSENRHLNNNRFILSTTEDGKKIYELRKKILKEKIDIFDQQKKNLINKYSEDVDLINRIINMKIG